VKSAREAKCSAWCQKEVTLTGNKEKVSAQLHHLQLSRVHTAAESKPQPEPH